jgi:D-lactate dehydrogenase
MDIMFYEAFDEESRLLRKLLPPDIEAGFSAQTVQALGDLMPPAIFISIRTQSIVPASWTRGLKGILSRSEGYDHLLKYRARTRTKARLGCLSGYCSRAVAEQALMLMLALFRKLPRQIQQLEVFKRDGLTGIEARGKNALVVGVGKIGREIVSLARGLGMEVRGVDIVRREKRLKYVSLTAGLSWADVVFCALPLTPKTEGIFDYRAFAGLKKKPFLVNIARGELLPLKDLIRLLEEGRLSGAAVDVYPEEGFLAESLRSLVHEMPGVGELHRLMAMDQVICTPHNAFNTEEALLEKCRQTVGAVVNFLKIGRFPVEVKR